MKSKKNYLIFKVLNKDEYHVIKEFNEYKIFVFVIHTKNNVYYKMLYEDFLKIRKTVPYYEFSIIKYEGPIYWKSFIRKYYLAIIGLLISFIGIFLLSFLIVDIEIETSDKHLLLVLNEALKKENIKPFTIKKSYNQLQVIKEHIKENYENEIDWIEITNIGMKYIINVEKRVKNNIENSPRYCNIYANKNGMIKRIKTYQGIPLVSMNDYVTKDDLLISGDITVNDKIVNQVCANGVVYAEVWYIVNIKVPLEYFEYESTNKKRNNIIIEYNEDEYPIFKNRLKNFDSNKTLIWEVLGIKIYKRKDTEVKKISKKYTDDEAIEIAKKTATEKINIKLSKDEKIIKQKVLQKQLIDSTMNIDIFIITEEKIGYNSVEG